MGAKRHDPDGSEWLVVAFAWIGGVVGGVIGAAAGYLVTSFFLGQSQCQGGWLADIFDAIWRFALLAAATAFSGTASAFVGARLGFRLGMKWVE